jgi:hypothetical protein
LARKIIPARERFAKKVRHDADGCWYWTGATNNKGYPQLRVDGRLVLAHRLAFELYNGPIPPGQCALHSCDHGPQGCVNPAHLWLGTRSENTEDMARKGRGRTSFRGLPYGVNTRNGCRRKPYDATVRYRGAKHYLGAFATALEATTAAQALKSKLYGLPTHPPLDIHTEQTQNPPMRQTERIKRDVRLNFDISVAERRQIFDAAHASGLDVAPWCRFILLAAARNANADSKQHPTTYPAVQHPPRAPETADTKPIPPVADTKPPAGAKRKRPWEPYGEPQDPSDTDGLDSPEAFVVPGLGSARFK